MTLALYTCFKITFLQFTSLLVDKTRLMQRNCLSSLRLTRLRASQKTYSHKEKIGIKIKIVKMKRFGNRKVTLLNFFLIYSDLYNIHTQQWFLPSIQKYKIILNKNITTFRLYLLVVWYLSLRVQNVLASQR
jgi:hypothetical protein